MASKLIIFTCLLAFAWAHPSDSEENNAVTALYKINRVIGGRDASLGEFPHQVSLQFGLPPFAPFSHICGGSIIHERWILTAAHCVNDLPTSGKLIIKAGKKLIKRTEMTEQAAVPLQIFKHRLYQGGASPYDIALIKLATPFVFSAYVNAIKLPKANVVPQGGAILSGYGSISKTVQPVLPDSLQKVTLPIIDLGTCRVALKNLRQPGTVHDTNMCTGPMTGGFSSCSGDSGGPLISKSARGTEIIGIVSWGLIPCAMPGAPAVFVRVSAFIDWITAVMRN